MPINKDNLTGKWEIPSNLDTTDFDFNWKPDPYDPPFIHQFGTQWQKTGGPRYVVTGATDVKYQDCQVAIKLRDNSRRWRGAENIEFDYSWHPDDTEPPFIYQFGTQWQKTGGPRYVVSGATVVKYIDHPKATKLPDMSKWFLPYPVDSTFDYSWHHDDTEPPFIYQFPSQYGIDSGPRYTVDSATTIKYMDGPVAKLVSDPNGWAIPENINDSYFDYKWCPPPSEPPFIYQFGTQWQKTGGPRYTVKGATVVKYMNNQQVIAEPNTNWLFLYDEIIVDDFDTSWHSCDSELEYSHIFGSEYYKPEEMPCAVYNPGFQAKYHYGIIVKFKPLDIIFMSNGEPGERDRYERLVECAGRDVKWVKGIQGRENAIKSAVEISSTEWALVFPAKLWVDDNFDFNWQPNRYGQKRHHIFYARNPVNDLCYGHMAPVAYNRYVVQYTTDYGLDFTMSGAHDVVPIVAGIAQYNCSPLVTWRTAFREVIKLKALADSGDQESAERLVVWTTVANRVHNWKYSILGAQHGVQYYDEVGGDPEKLQLSFSWDWLDQKFQNMVIL